MEDLNCLQNDLIRTLNPSKLGVPGFVGAHTDYQYLILIQSKDAEALQQWKSELQHRFSRPLQLSNGRQIECNINCGFILLDEINKDAYQVTQQAKAELR